MSRSYSLSFDHLPVPCITSNLERVCADRVSDFLEVVSDDPRPKVSVKLHQVPAVLDLERMCRMLNHEFNRRLSVSAVAGEIELDSMDVNMQATLHVTFTQKAHSDRQPLRWYWFILIGAALGMAATNVIQNW